MREGLDNFGIENNILNNIRHSFCCQFVAGMQSDRLKW
jgi:hypothetical protein